jgi:hypothetical protein
MQSSKAAAVMTVLLYSQALLGFAAVAAVLMKEPHPASAKKGTVTISVIDYNAGTAGKAG